MRTTRSFAQRLDALEALDADPRPLDVWSLGPEEWAALVSVGIFSAQHGGYACLGPARPDGRVCIWTTADPTICQPIADRLNDEWFNAGLPVARLLFAPDDLAALMRLLDTGRLICDPSHYLPHTPFEPPHDQGADHLVDRLRWVLSVDYQQRGVSLATTANAPQMRAWLQALKEMAHAEKP